MAREKPRWGYRRIQAAAVGGGHAVAAWIVRKIGNAAPGQCDSNRYNHGGRRWPALTWPELGGHGRVAVSSRWVLVCTIRLSFFHPAQPDPRGDGAGWRAGHLPQRTL